MFDKHQHFHYVVSIDGREILDSLLKGSGLGGRKELSELSHRGCFNKGKTRPLKEKC